MRVWVDLTNSPHVLVLRPVIEQLRGEGHEVLVTARDFAQTVQLAERHGLEAETIGHHRGGKLSAKAVGLVDRSWALTRWARGRRFDVALAHGSNDISVAALLLRIPSATMFDYEWARVQHGVNCRIAKSIVVPDAIPLASLEPYGATAAKVHFYEGLKEEYYLSDLEPDPAVLDQLGLDREQPIALIRTPPDVSLYHRHGNDLFGSVLRKFQGQQVVVLPRTAEQRSDLAKAGGFIVPQDAIDAPSLVAFSDLMVSAGGTMNREAVALGTPVWTTFAGRLGAVDERLIAEGRLKMLASADDVTLAKRDPSDATTTRVRRDPAVITELLLRALPGR